MTIGLYWHPEIWLHDKNAQHALMAPDRIQTVTEALLALDTVTPVLATPATSEQLRLAHAPEYLEILARSAMLPPGKLSELASDTAMNCYTWQAMRLSAGAMCQAVSDVLSNKYQGAFCASYAGHHAAYRRGAGFCFINSVLVGMHWALSDRPDGHSLDRIAILDFDAHSGDGTILGVLHQEHQVLFAETYQRGYPGAFLQKLTKPPHILRKKCLSRLDFRRGWDKLLTKVQAYGPQLIIVSAGFDAHQADPLGALQLHDEDYRWLAQKISQLNAPVVATLEGGYSTRDVVRCAKLFVEQLVSPDHAPVHSSS